MRLQIHWFGKFSQFFLGLKSPTSSCGETHWRQMDRAWIRDLVMQSNLNPGRAFNYALFNQLWVCEIFVFLEQCSGFL